MNILYHPAIVDGFIFTVRVADGETVTLPLLNTYVDGDNVTRTAVYNFVVSWGDGKPSGRVTSYGDADRVHA